MANKSVCVDICLRDGSKKEISASVQDGSGDVSYLNALSDVLRTVQNQTNSFLTEIVEKERGTTPVSQQSQKDADATENDEEDDDEDDDDADDDDADDPGEPPLKQQKT